MANPSTSWDSVPVWGFWFLGDDTTPETGQIKLSLTSRVTRVDGRRIYPEGATIVRTIGDTTVDTATRDAVRAAWLAADQAAQGASFDQAAWDARWNVLLTGAVFASFPASDDPDIVQTGYQVKVEEKLTSGTGKIYYIQPQLADLDSTPPGINLGLIDVPPGSPTAPAPIYAKGLPGGVASLDDTGVVPTDQLPANLGVSDASVAQQLDSGAQTQAALDTATAGLVDDAASATAARLKAAYVAQVGASSGTDDTAHINGLLAAGGVVRGTPGQTYLISAPLVIKSGGVLDMTGCTVRLKSGSNCNMLQNTAVNAVTRTFDPTTGAYTTTGPRDSDITVRGGLWDRQDNGGSPANGVTAHSLRFRHVDGLTVEDVTFASTAGKYQLNPGDCTRVRIVGVAAPATSSDTVHLNGPCSDVVIRDVRGGTVGDDVVSFTARDSTAVITDCAGDITDVLVDGVYFTAAQAGLFASALKVVAGQSDDTTRQFAVRRLTARNLTGPNTTADVAFIGDTSGGVIDDLLLDGVRSLGGASRGCVLLHGGTTVDRIRLRDLRPAAGDSYAVSSDTAITRLSVDGVEWVSDTGTPNVVYVADGTVQRVAISGVQGSAADGSALLRIGATGAVQRAVVSDCQLDGFRVVAGTTGMVLDSIDVANIDVIGSAYPLGNLYSVTTYKAANVTATGMTGWLWVLGSGAVTVTGASGLTGDNDTWAGSVLPAARGSNAFTVDPDMLTSGEETIDRRYVAGDGSVTSGNLVLTYFTARKTETINTVRTFVAGTAAAGTTLARIGIYRIEINSDHTLVASSTNDTTLWNSAWSGFTTPLSAAWAKQAGQRYAVGTLFVGTTGPNLRGVYPVIGAEDALAPRINGNLTGQTDLPASITTAIGQATGLSVYAALAP